MSGQQGPPFMVDGVPVIMPPPPGYVVNFNNPERQYDVAAYVTVAVFNFFVLLFAGQRLWTRHIIQRVFEAEDFCFVMAWMFSTVIQILITRCFATNILGTHSWEMPITDFFRFIKETLYVLPIMYAPVHLFVKMSLLLFYKRLSPQTWFRWAVFGAMFVIIGSNVSIMVAAIFPCRPIALSWDPTVPGECIDRPALFQATAILGVLTDAVLLAIPVPMVLGLRMRTANKIGLICIFAIASVTIVTSIVRLVVLIQQLSVVDQSWGTAPAGYWILVESNLAVVCAALPTLRVFVTSTMPRWFGESGTNSGKQGPSGGGSSKLSDGHSGPPTIGGTGGKRQKYSRFHDEAEFGLETLVKPGSVAAKEEDDVVGGEDAGTHGVGGGGDGDSEKGILQTRTTTVAYKESRRPPGSKPPVNLGLPPV